MSAFLSVLGLVLLGLGGLAGFLGWLWLLVTAFRSETLWGLKVLFIPAASIKYAMDYWEEAKSPFLTHMGGLGVAFLGVLALGGLDRTGGMLADDWDDYDEYAYEDYYDEDTGGEERRQKQASATSAVTDSTYVPRAEGGATGYEVDESKVRPFQRQTRKRPSLPATLPPERADVYLQQRVKVVKKSGNTFLGRLVSVDDQMVVVSQSFGSGRMDISIKKGDIDHLALP